MCNHGRCHVYAFAATRRVAAAIDDGESIGQLKRILTHFTFCAPDEFIESNIRVNSELEPQGCLGDLGWYTIRMSLFVANYQMPKSVVGRQLGEHGRHDSPSPVPMEFSGELFSTTVFRQDSITRSDRTPTACPHQRDEGNIQLHDFVLPYFGNELTFESNNAGLCCGWMRFRHGTTLKTSCLAEYSNNASDSQETNHFRNFSSTRTLRFTRSVLARKFP